MRLAGLVASAVLAWCLLLQGPCGAADAALIAAAKREGRVVWYTTLIVNQAVRPLAKAFEAEVSRDRSAVFARRQRADGAQNSQ